MLKIIWQIRPRAFVDLYETRKPAAAVGDGEFLSERRNEKGNVKSRLLTPVSFFLREGSDSSSFPHTYVGANFCGGYVTARYDPRNDRDELACGARPAGRRKKRPIDVTDGDKNIHGRCDASERTGRLLPRRWVSQFATRARARAGLQLQPVLALALTAKSYLRSPYAEE